jgi:hypothetical protein
LRHIEVVDETGNGQVGDPRKRAERGPPGPLSLCPAFGDASALHRESDRRAAVLACFAAPTSSGAHIRRSREAPEEQLKRRLPTTKHR